MAFFVTVDLDEKRVIMYAMFDVDSACIYYENNIGYFYSENVEHFCNCSEASFYDSTCQCPGYASVIARRESLEKYDLKGLCKLI
jgi:hypothetical protein